MREGEGGKEGVSFFLPFFPRKLKMQCDKTKFLSSSMSTKTLFQNVLDEMFKCAPEDTGVQPNNNNNNNNNRAKQRGCVLFCF